MADVDVVNLALMKLGDPEQLTSLSQNTKFASLCQTLYPVARKSELRKHTWNFAKVQVQLAADATNPTFDFNYRYLLPSDFLRLAHKTDSAGRHIVGRYIYTDTSAPLDVLYIKDVEDTEAWDPLFYDCLACRIALELAPVRTASNSTIERIYRQHRENIAEARRINAIELPPVEVDEDTWISVRRAGYQSAPLLSTG